VKEIAYSRDARRTLRTLPANVSARIMEKIGQLARNPESLANNIKRLKGSAFSRLRVGDWRIIFTDDGVVLAIIRIGARGNIYE
jgi:mRNA interferase RelE/StbE